MNKEEFEFPKIEVIYFGNSDIITSSTLEGETGGEDWDDE